MNTEKSLIEYYRRVRRVESEILTETLYIASVDNELFGQRAGGVCETTRRIAAECFAKGTHRPATGPEIERFNQIQAENQKESDRIESRRELKRFVIVNAETASNLYRSDAASPVPVGAIDSAPAEPKTQRPGERR